MKRKEKHQTKPSITFEATSAPIDVDNPSISPVLRKISDIIQWFEANKFAGSISVQVMKDNIPAILQDIVYIYVRVEPNIRITQPLLKQFPQLEMLGKKNLDYATYRLTMKSVSGRGIAPSQVAIQHSFISRGWSKYSRGYYTK